MLWANIGNLSTPEANLSRLTLMVAISLSKERATLLGKWPQLEVESGRSFYILHGSVIARLCQKRKEIFKSSSPRSRRKAKAQRANQRAVRRRKRKAARKFNPKLILLMQSRQNRKL